MQTPNPIFPPNLARRIWLHYFNDYLKERRVITEQDWRKMRLLIDKQ